MKSFSPKCLSMFILVVFFIIGANASGATFVVDVLSDGDDLAGYTFNNGTNTLRKCIRLANVNAGADVIQFNPGLSGVITLTDHMYVFFDSFTEIDGTTAFGAVAGIPTITVDGVNTYNGFRASASNCTINTLCVIRCLGAGITLAGGGTATNIKGCYIGLSTSGAASGNGQSGIIVATSGNTIGGSLPGERNVISANANDGMRITSSASGNIIRGNYFGLGADGSSARGNASNGIWIMDGSNNTVIGGAAPGAGNVIGFNLNSGILIGNNAGTNSGTLIQGNRIGITTSGSVAGNGGYGIAFFSQGVSSTNNIIGATSATPLPGEANVVAYNGSSGVYFQEPNQMFNPVRGNSIFCNGGLSGKAIDLWGGLANGGITAPSVDFASSTANMTMGTCNNGYDVHVYRNTFIAAGCNCQAEIYLGKAVTSGTSWSITHNLNLSADEQLAVSAIQTDPATNNTGPSSVCNSAPLPLNSIAFNARNYDNEFVELAWNISKEMNVNLAEIQRSTDNRTWQILDVVEMNATSNVWATWKDTQPELGIIFYRLNLKNTKGGEDLLSQTVLVEFGKVLAPVSIRPNPAHDLLYIEANTRTEVGEITLRLLDLQSKVLYELNFMPSGTQVVSVETFEKGIYLVQIISPRSASLEMLVLE